MGKTKKSKGSKKVSKPSKVKSAISSIAGKMKGGGKVSSGSRRRKKTPQWYAKEIMRLRLKKRYEKMKYSIR